MRLLSTVLAASFVLAPAAFTASYAQNANGTDIPPATTRSAFAGPAVKNGHVVTNSHSATSGAAAGGMATKSGIQAGGMAKKDKVPQTAP